MTNEAELGFASTKIQRLRRLLGRRSARHDEGVLVVEGATLIGEAIAAGLTVDAQFVAPGVAPVPGAAPVYLLAAGVAERVSALEAPPGVFAVVIPPVPPDDVLTTASFAVVAAAVSEPGNLGTIVRSAEASGADVVVTTAGTVDWTNPKVVRASAGSVFHVPIVTAELDAVGAAGLRLVGTSSHHGTPYERYDWSGRVAIVAGNEAGGLADDAPVDDWVTIAHSGRAESLNVAMATTLVCFEARRAR